LIFSDIAFRSLERDYLMVRFMSLEDEKDPVLRPLDALRALADDLAGSSRSVNTKRAYASSWNAFERWAIENAFSPLPANPETVALYLALLVSKGRATGTVQGALVAISQSHLDAGYTSPRNDPRVRRVIQGVRRRLGTEQDGKAAITLEQIDAMIASLPRDLRGLRDRAILAVAFASGLRRSELVALDVADIQFAESGLWITVRRSKWNPRARRVMAAGTGRESCPTLSIRAYFEAAGLGSTGPLFRKVSTKGRLGVSPLQDRAVARLVKAAARRIGLDEKRFSAHSMRAGFATASARAGAAPATIQRALGHASAGMTLRYIRDSDPDGVGPFHPGEGS